MSEEEIIGQLRNTLGQSLKELTGSDWQIDTHHELWDLQFICTLNPHRYSFRWATEWLDLRKSPENLLELIAKEAKVIHLSYERRNQ